MNNLNIHLNTMSYDCFRQKIINQSFDHWQYSLEKEGLAPKFMKVITFTTNTSNLPKATLILQLSEDDLSNTITVSNIIPSESNELSTENYNTILDDFIDNVLQPIGCKIYSLAI